ncbi:chaperone NapD [Sedimentitalea sp. XS_ASV28]|uniref:chaperone NapD n=1 Tax=Sedimentitalea sp. XS_ASV28 TaxID=3241296 RepID=UPI003517B828
MNRPLHISSLLVRSQPERMRRIADHIARMPDAEVSMTDPSGKIVVLLETGSDQAIADCLAHIQLLDGVASAALVFHRICEADDLSATAPELQGTLQ